MRYDIYIYIYSFFLSFFLSFLAAGEEFVIKFGFPEGILCGAGEEGRGVLVCREDNQGGALPGGGTAQSGAHPTGTCDSWLCTVQEIVLAVI